MARNAHPGAMAPHEPGRTRTAPPQLPDKFPMQGRYLAYTLFDMTGVIYLLLGFLILVDVIYYSYRNRQHYGSDSMFADK